MYCKNLDTKVVKKSQKWIIAECDLYLILASVIPFYSPGAAMSQYLNDRLSPIFAFGTFKNSIPALDQDTRAEMWGPA